jgi:hypothetical protein
MEFEKIRKEVLRACIKELVIRNIKNKELRLLIERS